MPPRDELPGDLSQRKLINALIRLGFVLNETGGKGDHVKLIWQRTQKCVVVDRNIRKDVLRYLLKEIEKISGVTWSDIRDVL